MVTVGTFITHCSTPWGRGPPFKLTEPVGSVWGYLHFVNFVLCTFQQGRRCREKVQVALLLYWSRDVIKQGLTRKGLAVIFVLFHSMFLPRLKRFKTQFTNCFCEDFNIVVTSFANEPICVYNQCMNCALGGLCTYCLGNPL